MPNILPIVLHPHPSLRTKAQPVKEVTEGIRDTLLSMRQTLLGANGIGLAAPQVALALRLVAIEPTPKSEEGERVVTPGRKPLLMVNPTIVAKSDDLIDSEEGCLSIPRVFNTIKRHAWVKVDYLDEQGNPQTVEGDGLLARCLQHEIDHLDGILFFDHLSKLKRDMLLKKYNKILPDFLDEKPYPFIQEM